jgi:hypothetical protein
MDEKHRRRKNISTRILTEDGNVISDILHVSCRLDDKGHDNIMSIRVYTNYREKRVLSIQICKEFTKSRDEIAKNIIRELIENEPKISCSEIKRTAGYGWQTVSRHYMLLKKIILETDKFDIM